MNWAKVKLCVAACWCFNKEFAPSGWRIITEQSRNALIMCNLLPTADLPLLQSSGTITCRSAEGGDIGRFFNSQHCLHNICLSSCSFPLLPVSHLFPNRKWLGVQCVETERQESLLGRAASVTNQQPGFHFNTIYKKRYSMLFFC